VTPPFASRPWPKEHDRTLFGCEEEAPDRYFETQVR
jgi:hypothetical protein